MNGYERDSQETGSSVHVNMNPAHKRKQLKLKKGAKSLSSNDNNIKLADRDRIPEKLKINDLLERRKNHDIDVKICYMGQEIGAHQILLKEFSEYCLVALSPTWKQTEKISDKPIIDLGEKYLSFGVDVVSNTINYFYGVGAPVLTTNNINEFLNFANYFGAKSLKMLCSGYLLTHLNVKNSLLYWILADMQALDPTVLAKCHSVAIVNFTVGTGNVPHGTAPIETLQRMIEQGLHSGLSGHYDLKTLETFLINQLGNQNMDKVEKLLELAKTEQMARSAFMEVVVFNHSISNCTYVYSKDTQKFYKFDMSPCGLEVNGRLLTVCMGMGKHFNNVILQGKYDNNLQLYNINSKQVKNLQPLKEISQFFFICPHQNTSQGGKLYCVASDYELRPPHKGKPITVKIYRYDWQIEKPIWVQQHEIFCEASTHANEQDVNSLCHDVRDIKIFQIHADTLHIACFTFNTVTMVEYSLRDDIEVRRHRHVFGSELTRQIIKDDQNYITPHIISVYDTDDEEESGPNINDVEGYQTYNSGLASTIRQLPVLAMGQPNGQFKFKIGEFTLVYNSHVGKWWEYFTTGISVDSMFVSKHSNPITIKSNTFYMPCPTSMCASQHVLLVNPLKATVEVGAPLPFDYQDWDSDDYRVLTVPWQFLKALNLEDYQSKPYQRPALTNGDLNVFPDVHVLPGWMVERDNDNSKSSERLDETSSHNNLLEYLYAYPNIIAMSC